MLALAATSLFHHLGVYSRCADYLWDRSSLAPQSPDTASPIYPNRPIRPLPKRRLRARLSSEQAGSITYPPIPPSSSPAYGSPNSLSERDFAEPKYLQDAHNGRLVEREHVCDCEDHYSGSESDEVDQERETHAPRHRGPWPKMAKYPRERAMDRPYQAPPPKSSTSSADGYESFENTNNKKKRKIPISNGTPASMPTGVEGPVVKSAEITYAEPRNHGLPLPSPTAGSGMSEPGRGRFSRAIGRSSAERKPLASTFANGAFRGLDVTEPSRLSDTKSRHPSGARDHLCGHGQRQGYRSRQSCQWWTRECGLAPESEGQRFKGRLTRLHL